MSAIQLLRAFVSQRLTVAVDEIIGVFERTICEYEEEIDRQRRLLGTERQPGTRSSLNIHTGLCQDIQPLIINTKIAPEQLQHIKEEPEESWSSQERQGFQGSDIPDFQFLPVLMKNEYVEEDSQLSQPHQNQTEENTDTDTPATRPAQQIKAIAPGEDCRGLEATFDLDVAGFVKATSNGQFFLSQCFKTETEVLDGDWNPMIRSDQPFLDTRKDNDTLSNKTSHNQKKLYKCPACSKTFKHNTALQRHITCHTGERPFDCTECGKTFRQKGSLHIHMRKHTGEKPFSCLVCGKNFTQSGTLAAHMRIHTGEKPFSCSVCKKRYNERGTLVRHMRVHTGEKPFTCSLCGKRFSEKGNLNKHKRIHTGEKPFSCMACEKKFSLLSHLKNHKCPGKKNSEAVEQELQLKCQKVTVQLTRHIV